jgi:hypothetical protein
MRLQKSMAEARALPLSPAIPGFQKNRAAASLAKTARDQTLPMSIP